MENTDQNNANALIKPEVSNGEDLGANDYINEFKGQAQEYGQKFQDAADKARVYANEKFAVASDKFKELQNKDPQELMEEAKDYARQKPGQTILISAAVGVVLGFLFRGRK